MRRATALLILATAIPALGAAPATPAPPAPPPKVEGDTALIVRSFKVPLKITATIGTPGKTIYMWSYPESLRATPARARFSKSATLEVTDAPAGTHKISVSSLTRGKDGDDVIEDQEVDIIVGNLPTPPGPGPGPQPDGAMGLTRVSREGLATVVSPTRDAAARKLAGAIRSHAAATAAGAFSGGAKILEGYGAAVLGALEPAERPAWKAWSAAVGARIKDLNEVEKKLVGNKEWSDAFKEVADGLAPITQGRGD